MTCAILFGNECIGFGDNLDGNVFQKTMASRRAKVRHSTEDTAGDSAWQQRQAALRRSKALENPWMTRQPPPRRPTTAKSTNESTPTPDSGQLSTLPGRCHVSPLSSIFTHRSTVWNRKGKELDWMLAHLWTVSRAARRWLRPDPPLEDVDQVYCA